MSSAANPLTVLVIDDTEPMRRLVGTVLRNAGFNVIEASDGEQALDAATRAGRVDAAVTDVCMPNLHGFSLASQLRERQPDLPLVFMSAFEVDHGAIGSNARLLLKPFSPAQLLRQVQSVLNPA